MSRRRARYPFATPSLEPLEPRLLLDGTAEEQAIQLFHTTPAVFIENQGQWADASVRFVHRGQGANIAHTDSGPVFELFREVAGDAGGAEAPDAAADMPSGEFDAEPAELERLRFSAGFDGASAVTPVGLGEAQTRFNFFLGDPADWREDVPSYEVVAYEGLYDGIDLHTWGRRDHLKYEFHVDPGADFSRITISYSGIDALSVDEAGALHVRLPGDWGEVVDAAPYIYQLVDGRQIEVAGAYRLVDGDTYAFEITGGYNPTRQLIIDPDLDWSSYLGGSGLDGGTGIAVDVDGSALVAGFTTSSGWVSGGWDPSFNGWYDAFVVKLSATGGHLWSTYLGGSSGDAGYGIAVDAAGNVLVTGNTESSGWVSGGWDTTYGGGDRDGFVAKLSPSGGHVWSSYLGGSSTDAGNGIAVDAAGNALVTGETYSAGWVSGGWDTTYGDGGDAFVVKLSPSGGHLWSSYLGGSSPDRGYGIAADAAGNALVTGETYSSGWVSGGWDTSHNGFSDVFVAKLSPTGGHIWSSYLGGGHVDYGRGIDVDASGDVLLTGTTYDLSAGWVSGGWDTSYNGGTTDGFVAKLSPSGGHVWSSYLGGGSDDRGQGIAADAAGNALVTGDTVSSGWVSGGWDTTYGGGQDAFVVKLSLSGGHLWSSYLGGSSGDYGLGIAADAAGNVLVTGYTWSSSWVSGGWDTSFGGGHDGLVAKITGSGASSLPDLALDASDVSLTPSGGGYEVSATVWNKGSAAASDVLIRYRDTFSGAVVGTYTIGSLGSWAAFALPDVSWTPSDPSARIEVHADPFDQIAEECETNNLALADPDGTPEILRVEADWDGNGDPLAFGRFVSGVELPNVFEAILVNPVGVAEVAFTLGPLGSKTDGDSGGGWAVDFDVGDLPPGDATLQVELLDADENVLDTWSGSVHVVAFPDWLGEPDEDDRFSTADEHYHLGGFFPEFMEQSFTMPEELLGIPIPIIGGTTTGFRAGIESQIVAPLVTSQEPDCSVEFVAFAEVFGQTLLDERYPPEATAGPFSLTVTDFDVDGEFLALEGLDLTATVTDLPLGSFETPEFTILGIGIPILADVTLRASAGIRADLDAGLTLHFDGSGIEITDAWIGPDITGWGSLIGAGRFLGFDFARAEGSLALTLSPEVHWDGSDWEFSLGGSLKIPWLVTLGPWVLGEGTIPDETGWVFTWDDMITGAPAGVLRQAEPDDPHPGDDVYPLLSGDQDALGNAIIVRALDVDPDPAATNSDIYYTYCPSGGQWSTLAPLAASSETLTTPVVAMDGQGGALAVWVANDLPTDGTAEPTMSELFQHQDLYGAYFDGSTWSAPVRITDDAHADGQPALACDPATGDAILVWTRSELADATDRSGFEIARASWDHATASWSLPDVLTADTAGDWSPQIAFNGNSQALAVWTRDDDGDLTTRELAYAKWDGGWSAPGASPGWSWASEAAITATPDGGFLVACVEEADTDEALLTAVYDPAADTWAPADAVAEGGIIQEPRLRVNSSGVCTLAWQSAGADGQNDILAATRDLAGGGQWSVAHDLTDTWDIEWLPVLLFDESGNPDSAYELIVAPEEPPEQQPAGLPGLGDDVGQAGAELIPDLAAMNVCLVAGSLVEGEEAQLVADVANVGWAAAAASTVQFYLGDPDDGGTPIGGPVGVGALAPGESVGRTSEAFTLPLGEQDYYAVVTPDPTETDTANNASYVTLETVPADTAGPQVVLDLPPGGALPEGTSLLTLTFDEPIVGVAERDISLVEATLGAMPPEHVYLSPDGMTATLIFEGGLPLGSYAFRVLDAIVDPAGNALDGDADGTPGGDYETGFEVEVQVVGRHVFYNGSAWDGGNAAVNADDDGAIAPSPAEASEAALGKQALLPGQTAGFQNYTSYSRGINGIMIDVARLADGESIDETDFVFRVGNDDDPAGWGVAPLPVEIAVREGAGAGGSDRITIIWADNAIEKCWLQVTVLATASTGLAEADVFYWGNAIGETGNDADDAYVNSADRLATRANPHNFFDPAAIDDAYDFDRDTNVNSADRLKARANTTNYFTALKLITAPPPAAPPAPPLAASQPKLSAPLAASQPKLSAPLAASQAYRPAAHDAPAPALADAFAASVRSPAPVTAVASRQAARRRDIAPPARSILSASLAEPAAPGSLGEPVDLLALTAVLPGPL